MIIRQIAKTILLSTIILLSASYSNKATAQEGKTIFNTYCAACHKMDKDLTGPALMGVEERWGNDREKLVAWVKNSANLIAAGDKHATDIFNKWNKLPMAPFETVLKDAEINAVLDYIKDWKPEVPIVDNNANQTSSDKNSLLLGIITLALALAALILLFVKRSLKKLSNEALDVTPVKAIPVWKNKSYIALAAILLFVVGGYFTTTSAIELGRNKGYEPIQPIFYSHKVHAGVNQINCLYCHGGAEKGKHANIPSVNVCMNCHKSITEYSGEQLYNIDGEKVDGTAEIKKLHEYAGFDINNANAWNPNDAKSIEWVQIHSLPDHVYFNHSQHVVVGKVECQTCHGEINKMDEVKQFTDLSMGWCVNCHRETKVQFKENGFYSIYEKYHNELKNGKLDSTKGITVEKIGGTECQKCHY
ncbi:MAG: c-type cytochrome [Chitinophagaceae bacterium]|nr:c-type cytochrome [Chitinophagaceae bacterium]MCW5906187.1 c-type cytochrome [Chitinophagaceae bacterium]